MGPEPPDWSEAEGRRGKKRQRSFLDCGHSLGPAKKLRQFRNLGNGHRHSDLFLHELWQDKGLWSLVVTNIWNHDQEIAQACLQVWQDLGYETPPEE